MEGRGERKGGRVDERKGGGRGREVRWMRGREGGEEGRQGGRVEGRVEEWKAGWMSGREGGEEGR